MRNLLSFIIIGIVFVVGMGLIVGGGGILVSRGWEYVQELSKQKAAEKQAAADRHAPPPVGAVLPAIIEKRNLLEARTGFETKAKPSSYQRDFDPPDELPDATLVRYPTSVGGCAAYLSKGRKDGEKLPAVVWAHSGFGGISKQEWEHAKSFHDAGFVLMVPSFRGENDNPGRFEFFYGEVNDLLAAVEYVAALPYVDPKRVYVAGHGAGGTLTLLAAVTGTTQVRAFFSLAGLPNTEEFIEVTNRAGYHQASPPYDAANRKENHLRSALPFVGAIRQPTFYFGAQVDDLYSLQAGRMQQIARAAGVPFTKYVFRNANHHNFVQPVIELLCQKIATDTGPSANITFEHNELTNLFPK
jgi:dipeptidyl aminopeptidase/acylaminoacyl peptidase